MEILLNEYFRLYIYYLFASQPYEKYKMSLYIKNMVEAVVNRT